eukprot:1141700-Pelagomonas_calceolata.AAC.6
MAVARHQTITSAGGASQVRLGLSLQVSLLPFNNVNKLCPQILLCIVLNARKPGLPSHWTPPPAPSPPHPHPPQPSKPEPAPGAAGPGRD